MGIGYCTRHLYYASIGTSSHSLQRCRIGKQKDWRSVVNVEGAGSRCRFSETVLRNNINHIGSVRKIAKVGSAYRVCSGGAVVFERDVPIFSIRFYRSQRGGINGCTVGRKTEALVVSAVQGFYDDFFNYRIVGTGSAQCDCSLCGRTYLWIGDERFWSFRVNRRSKTYLAAKKKHSREHCGCHKNLPNKKFSLSHSHG